MNWLRKSGAAAASSVKFRNRQFNAVDFISGVGSTGIKTPTFRGAPHPIHRPGLTAHGPMHRPNHPKLLRGSPISVGKRAVSFNRSRGLRTPTPHQGMGGLGSIAGGMMLGGMGGYWGGDGSAGDFIGGAMVGAVGGAALTSAASRGAFTAGSRFMNKKLGSGGSSMGRQAMSVGRQMQSKEGRTAMFGAGAFLSGGTFGMMFGNSKPSKRRGFNQHRGNGF